MGQGFDAEFVRVFCHVLTNPLRYFDIFTQPVIDQVPNTVGVKIAFLIDLLQYVLIQVNRHLNCFDRHLKFTLFGIGKVVFVLHHFMGFG